MSEGDLTTPVSPEENGLRETFLMGLPSELRDHLRLLTLGIYRLASRYGLLYSDPELDRDTGEMVGLWRDLDFLKALSGQYERQAQGTKRQVVRELRVLLEEAEAMAHRLVQEGLS